MTDNRGIFLQYENKTDESSGQRYLTFVINYPSLNRTKMDIFHLLAHGVLRTPLSILSFYFFFSFSPYIGDEIATCRKYECQAWFIISFRTEESTRCQMKFVLSALQVNEKSDLVIRYTKSNKWSSFLSTSGVLFGFFPKERIPLGLI